MPTVADYLKYANVQMAAEALYGLAAATTESNQPPPALRPGQPIDGQIELKGSETFDFLSA
jgi:hypothetical protein